MSLVVGELVGYLRMEDGLVRPALARMESAMRHTGQQVTGDADRAGTTAGRGLGDGLTAGAADGGDRAADAAESGFGKIQAAALGVGVAAGAILMEGLGQALEQGQIAGKLGASLGATPAEAKKYGQIAGAMYADAVTEDFQGAADAIAATMSAGLAPPGATNAQLQSIATKVSDLAGTFELDLGQAANAVGQIMKTGLAPDAESAMDVITRGLQVMGPRADDIGDTFNEYSTIFRQMGLSAGDATGIMAQGMQAGARDTDVVADSLKELTLITQGGGKAVDQAFGKIGLSGSKMQTAFSQGGPKAKAALDQIFDGLRKVKDPATRAQLAVTLFGTKAEDMQKALFAIDPSKAVGSLGQIDGAAAKTGNSLRDNAGVQFEQFKRKAMQGIVTVLGAYVIPAFMQVVPVLKQFGGWLQKNSGTVKVVAGVIAGVLFPVLALMGVNATIAGAKVVVAWVTSGAAATVNALKHVAAGARVVASWVLMGLRAAAQALRVVAGWVLSAAAATLNALLQVAAGAMVVASWVLMGVQSLIQAGRMAAAWFIALGPVGWVIAALIGLGLLIWANWDKIKAWTLAAWNWIWDKIKGVTIGIVAAVVTFVVKALAAWDRFKTQAALKIAAFIGYVRGLPGRIGSAVGNLGKLLVGKGRDVVMGLWNGIKGMGGWLRSTLMGWARDLIPGPIAKALGIASPSKLMRDKIGRYIPAGIVAGIEDGSGALDSTMAGLVTPPSLTATGGVTGGSMAGGSRRSGAGGRITLEVTSDGGRVGDALVGLIKENVRIKGGNVDLVLGA